jgi:hypothetical protein
VDATLVDRMRASGTGDFLTTPGTSTFIDGSRRKVQLRGTDCISPYQSRSGEQKSKNRSLPKDGKRRFEKGDSVFHKRPSKLKKSYFL